MRNSILPWPAAVTLLAALFLLGCGQTPVQKSDVSHFKAVAVVYGKYLGSHGGRKPKDRDDFLKFVGKSQFNVLERLGIESTECLFVSPRDGEPLVFDFEDSAKSGLEQIIAYEQTGVGGKRIIITSLGSVEELDAEQFRQRVR